MVDLRTSELGICILASLSLECKSTVSSANAEPFHNHAASGFSPTTLTMSKSAMMVKLFSLRSQSEAFSLQIWCFFAFIFEVCPVIFRSSWAIFSDDLGNASMPLFQGVILETASVLLHMNFSANLSNTNRLLFPCVWMLVAINGA